MNYKRVCEDVCLLIAGCIIKQAVKRNRDTGVATVSRLFRTFLSTFSLPGSLFQILLKPHCPLVAELLSARLSLDV